MITALFVTLLGGLGAVARYALATWAGKLPWGILAANTLAAVIGMFALQLAGADSDAAKVVIAGFAGGLSTYSSMVAGTEHLFQSGKRAVAAANLAANLVIPSTAAYLAALVSTTLLK